MYTFGKLVVGKLKCDFLWTHFITTSNYRVSEKTVYTFPNELYLVDDGYLSPLLE